ncbi:MAG TPA: glycine cleavage system protein GcvH [Candidatus Limnocylindrales bacterium]|jgi:glycine cleavage system H protein|nr:glycine cleavage system protein GcvH [Candidatus Limnocylindrales bacterium]
MYPEDLKYTKEHEWVRVVGNKAIVGITEFAQDQLGDVVFIELPEVGEKVKQFESFGTIESVKAVSDLYAPLSGEVVKVNDALEDEPERVNKDPYGEGWMLEIEIKNPAELNNLISAKEYEAYIKDQAK